MRNMSRHMYIVRVRDRVHYTKCLHYIWKALTDGGVIGHRDADEILARVPALRTGEFIKGKVNGNDYVIVHSNNDSYDHVNMFKPEVNYGN